jgi:hypothetical protein
MHELQRHKRLMFAININTKWVFETHTYPFFVTHTYPFSANVRMSYKDTEKKMQRTRRSRFGGGWVSGGGEEGGVM